MRKYWKHFAIEAARVSYIHADGARMGGWTFQIMWKRSPLETGVYQHGLTLLRTYEIEATAVGTDSRHQR